MTLVAAVRGAQGIGCEETGHGGRNEVNEWGGNYWVEDVEGGSNQTYLKLNVRHEVYCQAQVPSPKSQVPKSRPKGLGLTLKSHGPLLHPPITFNHEGVLW